MSKTRCLSFLMPMIGVLIMMMMSLDVDAQSTVDEDEGASCESSTQDLALNLIRKDLTEVKNLLGSRQQTFTAVDSSSLSNCLPLLVQQNLDGSDFFNRSWAEFKVGFNDTRGNYWLGNELLHQLTTGGRYQLRFDLQAFNNSSWYYAEYSGFIVFNEGSNYKVRVTGFSGGNVGNAFLGHDGMNFTTYDRDNDQWPGNCAVHNGGGFWYRKCASASVNTLRGKGNSFTWTPILSLQKSRMWLMC